MSRIKKHKRTTRTLYEGIALQEIEPGKFNYWFVNGNAHGILAGIKYFTGSYPTGRKDPKLTIPSGFIRNNKEKSILLSRRKALNSQSWSYSKLYIANNGKKLFDQVDSSYIRKITLYKRL
jgi:hypothetical protein